MQTLWTRVAQTRTACRCSQCLPALQAASRRATVAATHRVPKYITSSTLWYSGVFAVAATYDASRKMRRREEWERVIAEAQDELEVVEATIEQNTRAEWMVETVRGIDERDVLATEANAAAETRRETLDEVELSYDGDVPAVQDELERHMDSTRPTTPLTGVKSSDKTLLIDQLPVKPFHMPPQSIYADALQKERLATKRWSEKKLETIEMCVDLLQLKAFAEIQDRGLLREAADCVPRDYARFIELDPTQHATLYNRLISDLKRLKNGRWDEYQTYSRSRIAVPLCRYEQDAAGEHLAVTGELNRALRALFQRRVAGTLPPAELLAKVWYNLHISTAPPNIDTFNILILGFARAREPEQARNVISALHLCKLRPNEVTLAAVLRFFTATRDARAFGVWFAYMRGWYDGLMLARPDISINRAGRDRLVDFRAPGAPLGKVVQLPPPTPMVFGALIRGVLLFDGFEAALDTCRGMRAEGWALNMSGWAPLLKDCARRADAVHGFVIWEEIMALHRRSAGHHRRSRRRDDDDAGPNTDAIHLDTYTSMLRLCARCDRKDLFARVLSQASAEHRIGPEPLARLIAKALGEDQEFQYTGTREASSQAEDSGASSDLSQDEAWDVPLSEKEYEKLMAPLMDRKHQWPEETNRVPDDTLAKSDGGHGTPRESDVPFSGEHLRNMQHTTEPASEYRPANISAPTHRTVPSRPMDDSAHDYGPDPAAVTDDAAPALRIKVAYSEYLFQKPDRWIFEGWRDDPFLKPAQRVNE